MSGSLWNCACQRQTRSVCLSKTQLRVCRAWKYSLSFSLQWVGWAGPGFLPKSSLRFPVLSIILIHTARKHLLSIPYHTRSSRWSCNSTQWFLCQWEKSFSSSSHHLVSVVCPNCQTQAPEIQETLPQRVQRSEFIQFHFWTLIFSFCCFQRY